jgi:hypothetical protein
MPHTAIVGGEYHESLLLLKPWTQSTTGKLSIRRDTPGKRRTLWIVACSHCLVDNDDDDCEEGSPMRTRLKKEAAAEVAIHVQFRTNA